MTTNQTEKPVEQPVDERAEELAQRIRNAMNEVRRKSYPLADLIPMMQQAADMLEAEAQRPALKPLPLLQSEIVDQMPADLFPEHMTALYRFARAIEAAHGIKEQA